MSETLVEDVPGHRGEPHQVRARTRMQEDIGTPRHFILAQVRDDELLTMKFVGAFHAGSENRVAFRGVAPYDQHEVSLLDVGDRTGISAKPNRAK